MKPPAEFSRRTIDPANSVAWFAMDALWLSGLEWPAYAATVVALATGALLLIQNRRWGPRLNDDLVLNAWMWTNALWLLSDLGERPALRSAALVVCGAGAVLLVNALRPSKRRPESLSRIKKLRVADR
jgi:hypothetical protein